MMMMQSMLAYNQLTPEPKLTFEFIDCFCINIDNDAEKVAIKNLLLQPEYASFVTLYASEPFYPMTTKLLAPCPENSSKPIAATSSGNVVDSTLNTRENLFDEAPVSTKQSQTNSPTFFVHPAQETPQNNKKGYELHPASTDRDSGFNAFGITRIDAAELLQDNIFSNADAIGLLKPLIEESLKLSDGPFFQYLHKEEITTLSFEQIQQQLKLGNITCDLAFISAFIEFDINVLKNWAHPTVLQAMAEIQGINIYMWTLNPDQSLAPYHKEGHDYACHKSKSNCDNSSRVDLLFVINEYLYHRIELVGFGSDGPAEGETIKKLEYSETFANYFGMNNS